MQKGRWDKNNVIYWLVKQQKNSIIFECYINYINEMRQKNPVIFSTPTFKLISAQLGNWKLREAYNR
jgi:hypothetical protein